MSLPPHLRIPDFEEWGITAFTTSRAAGTFGTHADEPAVAVLGRWHQLVAGAVEQGVHRFASASQVHGADVAMHGAGWAGWLRCDGVDGHAWVRPGTGAAVTIADCVPVFIAHPSGAGALLHSGWRGTVAGITERAVARLVAAGFGSTSLRVHLGPAICGGCYEVSPEVHEAVTGIKVESATALDLRSEIASRIRRLGVRDIAISEWCTRCSNDRLFSHRAGDGGRQVGVLLAPDARKS